MNKNSKDSIILERLRDLENEKNNLERVLQDYQCKQYEHSA
jgi:hypothetical protein